MRQILWALFQIAIVAMVTLTASDYAASQNRPTSAGDVAMYFVIGVIIAAFLTGLLTRLFDLTAALARRVVGQKRTRQNGGPVVTTGGQFLNSSDAIRAGRK